MQKLPEKLYLASQVRELDRITIEEKGIPGISLMRKAGQAVFDLVRQHYPDVEMLVFCGAGNNAGDGYVVAKLALLAGLNVRLYYLSDPEKLTADALTAYQDFIQAGGRVYPFEKDIKIQNNIIIDALLGTGLNRFVSGQYAAAISTINNADSDVISVDIPSGLNADSGCIMGCAVKATYTVSFIALKQGMFTGAGVEHCGSIKFASLDVPQDVFEKVDWSAKLIKPFNPVKRDRNTHKGHFGHVLVIGGDEGYSGAVRLAAEAALRTGAGLVSVATRKIHAGLINIGRPELMCHGVETADELLPLLQKATVIVIGPGLGQAQWARTLLTSIMEKIAHKPLVVDADALNLLANTSIVKHNWVLTPHPGEAARLLHCSTTDIAEDRFAAVSEIQRKFAGVAILKGAGTLIDDGKEISVSVTGNPGMASGGMGDTLTGIIGGLLAQKYDLSEAALSAVYLHGLAADYAAKQDGEVGMLASDVMAYIRKCVNANP